ncbi:MAG: hypothetical protein ACK4TA_26205, partial [Saprospiraceae bacterium]
GAAADWLATACSVLSLQKAKKLLHQVNKTVKEPDQQAKLLITYWKNGKIKTQKLGNFEQISIN